MANRNTFWRAMKKALAVTMVASMIGGATVAAKGPGGYRPGGGDWKPGGESQSGDNYEWYKIVVQGVEVDAGQGPAGDIGWLVWGVYSWDVDITGTTMTWRAGNQSGTVDLNQVIQIPEDFEVQKFSAESISVEGTNTQAAKYDNATITVTIEVLYNEKTDETIEMPETEPQETDPVETDPVETDPVETDPVETDPVETDPVETDPVETDPVETDPVETDPVETDPAETDPVETDPVETDPVETDPVEQILWKQILWKLTL